jgi:hypothetical protein
VGSQVFGDFLMAGVKYVFDHAEKTFSGCSFRSDPFIAQFLSNNNLFSVKFQSMVV